MKKLFFLGLLIAGFILISDHVSLAQCAMCKSNIEMAREGGGTNVGNTLNNGIMYLLVLPYAIAAVFGFIYYKKYKEKKAAEQKLNAPSHS
ncbi:MAG: hypothetical protein MH472_02890 [Bacteroidia bacterium]|nr:hypothetical protein [Bacteroidia bacterium]